MKVHKTMRDFVASSLKLHVMEVTKHKTIRTVNQNKYFSENHTSSKMSQRVKWSQNILRLIGQTTTGLTGCSRVDD